MTRANETQIGGEHYLYPPRFQLWDVLTAWNLGWLESNIVKYLYRYKEKGGLADLKKAKHYLDKLIETVEESR